MSSLDTLVIRRQASQPEETIDAPERGSVLIVDDEQPIAEALAIIVGETGYHADIARHGLEALAKAQARWPALVLTDMMMPYLDGAGLIAALRAEAESGSRQLTPIVVMTASNSRALRSTGADAILRKPFDLKDVEELLRRFLPRP